MNNLLKLSHLMFLLSCQISSYYFVLMTIIELINYKISYYNDVDFNILSIIPIHDYNILNIYHFFCFDHKVKM